MEKKAAPTRCPYGLISLVLLAFAVRLAWKVFGKKP
jgi:hypothetical protein